MTRFIQACATGNLELVKNKMPTIETEEEYIIQFKVVLGDYKRSYKHTTSSYIEYGIYQALLNDHIDVADYLLKNNGIYDMLWINIICKVSEWGNIKALQYFDENDYNLNIMDTHSMLCIAVINNHYDVVKWLLHCTHYPHYRVINIDIINKITDYCIYNKQFKIYRLLLASITPDINITSKYMAQAHKQSWIVVVDKKLWKLASESWHKARLCVLVKRMIDKWRNYIIRRRVRALVLITY